MRFDARMILFGAAVALTLSGLAHAAETGRLGIGHPATPAEIAGWDIDVRADGQGLPAGHGGVREGEAIYAQACAGCHGAKGEGKPADRLAGGFGTLATAKPVRTVGSYWPYATTLFDFVRRAMPFDAPQSLTADQVTPCPPISSISTTSCRRTPSSTPPRCRRWRCRTATASPAPTRGRTCVDRWLSPRRAPRKSRAVMPSSVYENQETPLLG